MYPRYAPNRFSRILATRVLLLCLLLPAVVSAAPLVIAHRGASAYLPEHTLAASAMAYAMHADYLELDVVLTKDRQAVVFHDLYLDAMTDVASRYPGRARDDGRHYVADFSLTEISRLKLNERIDLETGKTRYPGRFNASTGLFRIPTLDQVLQLVRGLNHSGPREMGVYVEIKNPVWHAQQGMDIAAQVIEQLHDHGYRRAADPAFIQCFDAATLQRIAAQNLTGLPLIQLIGENRWWPEAETDYDYLRTPAGLREISTYAAGIGPWLGQIVSEREASGEPHYSALVADAHAMGLLVHPYTLRADRLPKGVDDLDQLLDELINEQKVDGVFTDHPDRLREFLLLN